MNDWYRGDGERQAAEGDPFMRGAKLSLQTTGQPQVIHWHSYGKKCNEKCIGIFGGKIERTV